MIISLIGMSGSGKTYWSKKLAQNGFTRICVDDLIENKLFSDLSKMGYQGIAGVAKWMGQPYEPKFKENQSYYLKAEKQIMQKILLQIKSSSFGHRVAKTIVIDTTGSVIYLGSVISLALKKYTTVVYLKISKSEQVEMFKQYLKDPKPVIWGDSFKKSKGESNQAVLEKCYPKLLQRRAELYQKYADLTLDVQILNKHDFSINDFLKAIKTKI